MAKIHSVNIQTIQEAVDEPDMVSYCCLLQRPGIYAWIVEVEYTRFKPDTDANDDFHMAYVSFPEDIGLKWVIVIFHQSEQQFAESILWKNGLRKVKEGYVGMILSSKGKEDFPIKGPRVFFLENHSRQNVVYTNDPIKMKAAFEHEKKQVQPFFDAHKKWFESPEGKAIADAYWAKHPEGYNR